MEKILLISIYLFPDCLSLRKQSDKDRDTHIGKYRNYHQVPVNPDTGANRDRNCRHGFCRKFYAPEEQGAKRQNKNQEHHKHERRGIIAFHLPEYRLKKMGKVRVPQNYMLRPEHIYPEEHKAYEYLAHGIEMFPSHR